MIVAVALLAQQPSRTTFEEREAFLLSNGPLALTIFPTGATIADLVLADDAGKMSPIWNPVRLAREAGQPPRFGASFGHFLCVDGFGPVSAEEQAAGLRGHGEAHVQTFEVVSYKKAGKVTELTMSAKLPLLQEDVVRTYRMAEGENVVHVLTEIENLLAFDRPMVWAEHATIGAPFLERGQTAVDLPAGRSRTRPYQERAARAGAAEKRLASDREFTWPNAPLADGGHTDVRIAPLGTNSTDHTTTAFDASRKHVYVTAIHPGKRLIFGYVLKREEFPWLQSWEFYPSSNTLARGLEFSTQPFDVPRRQAIDTGRMFGIPTYRWLPGRSKVGSHFLMFYARTPANFTQVDDLRVESGEIVIEDRRSGQTIRLRSSFRFE